MWASTSWLLHWSPPAPDVIRGATAASRADASSSLRARCSRSRSSCSSKNCSRSSWVKAGLSIFMAPPMYPAKSEPAARFRGDPVLLENRLMCYTDDARPPLPPISGAAADQGDLELTASDGNRFAAYFARAEKPSGAGMVVLDRKSTRLNSSHLVISYAVFCLKKKKKPTTNDTYEHNYTQHNQP